MSELTKKLLLSSTLLSVLAPSTVSAQVEEIFVTARRKQESLKEVPIAVSAFGAEQIARLQINQPIDIAASVPNLQFQPVSANGAALAVHMRGASLQTSGFNASESPVGLYIDNVYFGRMATANIELIDIDRIEVLRGPQGTLYGRNTIAGALKFVSRTPEDDPWFQANVGYGAFETLRISASAGGPLIEGVLGGSASVAYSDRSKGFYTNPTQGTRPGEFENLAGRLKLHYFGGEKFRATLQFLASDVQNDGTQYVPYAPFVGPGSVPGTPIAGFYSPLSSNSDFGDATQWSVSLDATYAVNDEITLRSTTAFSENEDAFGFDLAGGGFDVGGPGMPFFVNGLFITSDSENTTFSQEFQVLGDSFDGRLDWIAGVFYLSESGSQVYQGDSSPFFGFRENSSQDTDSYSVFGEATYALTENLSIVAGARYTIDEKRFELTCNDLPTAGPGCFPASGTSIDLDETFKEPTFKVGLQWKAAEDQLLYATFSQGFQAGGFQTLCFGNTVCASNVFSQQTVSNFELGYKATLWDGRLSFDAAAFFALYDDIQQTLVTAAGFPVSNVGEVDVYGFEFEATLVPVEGLRLFANLGILESDYGTLNPAALANPNNDLPVAPPLSFRIGGNYESTLPKDYSLSLGLDYAYTGSYFSEVTNALPIDRYGVLNGLISLKSPQGHYALELSGKNLTDNEIIVSGIVQPGFANVRQVLPPREWMLTFRVNY